MWIPIDAIFRGGGCIQTPVKPSILCPSTPERCERPDQCLLEVAAVALDVAPVPVQVENGVADELSGPVEGRLAAAVGLHELHVRALRDVQLRLLGAAAGRDRRRVLEQEDRVRLRPLGHARGDPALQLPGLTVRHDAEIQHRRAVHALQATGSYDAHGLRVAGKAASPSARIAVRRMPISSCQ